MIRFFQTPQKTVIATEVDHQLNEQEIKELNWLYGEATLLDAEQLEGYFVGPRREMVTPWSTNAVEITQNMGLQGISRIEEYFPASSKDAEHDEMLQRMYNGLNQDIFTINIKPEPIKYVDNLEEYIRSTSSQSPSSMWIIWKSTTSRKVSPSVLRRSSICTDWRNRMVVR